MARLWRLDQKRRTGRDSVDESARTVSEDRKRFGAGLDGAPLGASARANASDSIWAAQRGMRPRPALEKASSTAGRNECGARKSATSHSSLSASKSKAVQPRSLVACASLTGTSKRTQARIRSVGASGARDGHGRLRKKRVARNNKSPLRGFGEPSDVSR